MSLHQTVEWIKKIGLGAAIGLGSTITLVIIIRVGIFMKDVMFPPKIDPPNHTYGVLSVIQFPRNVSSKSFTYTLNTLSGKLPVFPDRLVIYPVVQPEPNLLNLDKARIKAGTMGFTGIDGNTVQEIPLGNSQYEWDVQDPQTSMTRKLTFNTVNFGFRLISDYLPSLTVLQAQNLSDQNAAILTAQTLLNSITLFPTDIDLTKTNTPNPTVNYVTYPQLYSIQNDTLIPATSLSNAQIIRVDFYQKDIPFKMTAGIQGDQHTLKSWDLSIPIVYPNPPYSTMSFWIGSGQSSPQAVQANFVHQGITIPPTTGLDVQPPATYAIKSADQAFSELKTGQGYIAAYTGNGSSILIKDVYLAYYLGETQQQYLQPIIVFEGDNGFFGYVPAITSDWAK